MKPRFVLEGENGLKPVNLPVPPPEEVPGILSRFDTWPLRQYEWFYNPEDYRLKWWRISRLGAFLEAKTTQAVDHPGNTEIFRLEGERGQIALRIVQNMRREAEEAGSRFYVLHLPRPADLNMLQKGLQLPYHDLLSAIEHDHALIRPEKELLASARHDPEAVPPDGHYGPKLHAVVARVVAERLRKDRDHPRVSAAP